MAKSRAKPPQPEESKYGTLIVVILLPLATAFIGAIGTGYALYNSIATKVYVDDKYSSSIKYSDEKSAQILKEAYEHSDTNRREMMIKTEQMIGDLKIRNAVVDTKIEVLIKSTNEIKDWTVLTNAARLPQRRP